MVVMEERTKRIGDKKLGQRAKESGGSKEDYANREQHNGGKATERCKKRTHRASLTWNR